ncbi:hypothetical protein WMY93_004041 [Mugilogobius chulae]|uniref:F5/8 type C domain-containing protein n=1 Tax=Mugilogobius chulae TaxID=88201 RepID=A0AAW0PMI2_9GOBI
MMIRNAHQLAPLPRHANIKRPVSHDPLLFPLFLLPAARTSITSHYRQHKPVKTTVDLGFLRFVSAIGTQGAISQETRKIYFVKSYKVDVSSNGEDWITLKEGSKQKVFQGNTNPTDVTKTMLPRPTLTRYLRIRPVTWETGIALRFEVFGCKISGETPYTRSRMRQSVSSTATL